MKEQENSPEEELNERAASNFSDRVSSKDYKDAEQHEERHRSHKKQEKTSISEINNT